MREEEGEEEKRGRDAAAVAGLLHSLSLQVLIEGVGFAGSGRNADLVLLAAHLHGSVPPLISSGGRSQRWNETWGETFERGELRYAANIAAAPRQRSRHDPHVDEYTCSHGGDKAGGGGDIPPSSSSSSCRRRLPDVAFWFFP